MYHSTYKGCDIYRNTRPGPYLRWTARTSKGQVAADTLVGIRQAITEAEGQ